MSKRSHLTVTLIGGGVLLCTVLLILWAVLSPRLAAGKALSEQLELLRQAERIDCLTVTDPVERPGERLPTDRETRLTEAERLATVRDRLCEALDGADYVGEESGEKGNWDLRLRFAVGEERVDFYARAEDVYVVRGNVRFVFAPADASLWEAVYGEIMALFEAP